MSRQTVIGSSLIAVAIVMFISGIGDQLQHLQHFDGLTLTQALGVTLKSGAQIALGVLGGTLLPGVGSASADLSTNTKP